MKTLVSYLSFALYLKESNIWPILSGLISIVSRFTVGVGGGVGYGLVLISICFVANDVTHYTSYERGLTFSF